LFFEKIEQIILAADFILLYLNIPNLNVHITRFQVFFNSTFHLNINYFAFLRRFIAQMIFYSFIIPYSRLSIVVILNSDPQWFSSIIFLFTKPVKLISLISKFLKKISVFLLQVKIKIRVFILFKCLFIARFIITGLFIFSMKSILNLPKLAIQFQV
jgi:hypothetical protein